MRLLTGAAAGIVMLSCTPAFASPDLLLTDTAIMMSGTHHFRQVRLTNTKLTVTPSDGSATTGYIQIVAHSIQIDAQSSIVANAAGTQGVQGGEGQGQGKGLGALLSAGPGGGGGHGGKGGPGVSLVGCVFDPNAPGGLAYPSSGDQLTEGSSGSAAALLDAGVTRGGNAGGLIDLQAGRIELLGSLSANGEDGTPATEPAGGGSGGGVRLAAVVFATWGNTATVLARGGSGGVSSSHEGGSGGGGKVFLAIPQTQPIVNISVDPGASGCAQAAGQPGMIQYFPALPCNDWDGDSMLSDQCTGPSGSDCDDTDSAVHPGAEERCNGQDDDCDGTIDDGADAACGGGTCVGGQCVGGDAGPDAADGGLEDGPEEAAPDGADEQDSGDAEAPEADLEGGKTPEGYELKGGCAAAPGPGNFFGWALILLAVASVKRFTRA